MMQNLRFAIGAVLMVTGLFTCAVGVMGIFKFRYAANRMHSAAINDTLGISLCMLGLAVLAPDIWSAIKLLLVIFFFWISAPVASHLLCRLEVETNENRGEMMKIHLIDKSVDKPGSGMDDPCFGLADQLTDEPNRNETQPEKSAESTETTGTGRDDRSDDLNGEGA